MACLRRDMLLASVLAMLLLLRSGMPLRFADTSAKRGANVSTHSSKKEKGQQQKTKTKKKEKREEKSSPTVLVVAGAERARGTEERGEQK